MSHLTFTPTDHYAFTVINEDTGVNFRISDLCLHGATPSGRAAPYTEDWSILALLADDGHTVQRLTDTGRWLEDEAEGIIEGAIAALLA